MIFLVLVLIQFTNTPVQGKLRMNELKLPFFPSSRTGLRKRLSFTIFKIFLKISIYIVNNFDRTAEKKI